MKPALVTSKPLSLNFNDVETWFGQLPSVRELEVLEKAEKSQSDLCFSVKSKDKSGDFGIQFRGELGDTRVSELDVYALHSPEINYECAEKDPASFNIEGRGKEVTIKNLPSLLNILWQRWVKKKELLFF